MKIWNFGNELSLLLTQGDSNLLGFITYFWFVCCTKKLLELPVERDFPKENAFNAAQYPFLFQQFLRIRFFDAEVRFFGTAISILNWEITHWYSWMWKTFCVYKKSSALLIHFHCIFLFFLANVVPLYKNKKEKIGERYGKRENDTKKNIFSLFFS